MCVRSVKHILFLIIIIQQVHVQFFFEINDSNLNDEIFS